MTKLAKVGLVVTAVILAVPVALIVFLGLTGRHDQHQSDEALIENFNSHRSEFEQLRTMSMDDKTLRYLDEGRVWPADIDLVKVNEYRRLLKVAGLRRGMIRDERHIEFLSSAEGWGPSGSIKGYMVLMGKLDNVSEVESLDVLADLTEGTYFLRPIQDNWYLYLVTR